MKQPMSKAEIAVWDTYVIAAIPRCVAYHEVFKAANDLIAARRAALIADAHVGVWCHSYRNGWMCRCHDGITHSDDTGYCEACHTRRPDEVAT